MPVPVIRNTPCGKLLSRSRYSTSVFGSRFNSVSATDPENSTRSWRTYLDCDLRRVRQWARGHKNSRPQRAAAVVDLGLRQIQRILAFDIARAHIVANRVADDAPRRTDHQRQFRLRHGPVRIPANFNLAATAHRPACRRLEKKLRPLRRINAIVKVSATRILRLLHARTAAAIVRDAGGPDFLPG